MEGEWNRFSMDRYKEKKGFLLLLLWSKIDIPSCVPWTINLTFQGFNVNPCNMWALITSSVVWRQWYGFASKSTDPGVRLSRSKFNSNSFTCQVIWSKFFILSLLQCTHLKKGPTVVSTLCHSLPQGIFLTLGSNPGLLHWRQILYRLSHQRSQPIL